MCAFIFLMINDGVLLLAGEGPYLHVFVDRSVGMNDIVSQQYRGGILADISCKERLKEKKSLFEHNGIPTTDDSFYLGIPVANNVCNITSFAHLTSYTTGKQLLVYPFPVSFLQDKEGNFKKLVQLDGTNYTVVQCHFPLNWMTMAKRAVLFCVIMAALYGCFKMGNGYVY